MLEVLYKNLHCGSYCTPTVSLPILLTSHAFLGNSSLTAKESNVHLVSKIKKKKKLLKSHNKS